jgi:sialate O-acetylesterase
MKKKLIPASLIVSCLLYLFNVNTAIAALKLPAIIGDNMVLQRNIKVPIWGWADPGKKVQIMFQKRNFEGIAGSDGKWALKLNSYQAGGPYQMLIKSGNEQVLIKNILIGDVWITSGQSNMEFGIQSERHGAEAIAKGTDTLIHFFYVPMAFALQPQEDIGKVSGDSPNGKWMVCSPQLLADTKWAWHGFSAIGYYFALQMRSHEGCPVGMIATYKGGTPAQAWVSMAGLKQQPAFKKYVVTHDALVENYENANAGFPQQMTAYRDALTQWNTEVGNDFNAAKKQWEILAAQAKANGQASPPQPRPARPAPKEPAQPAGGFGAPSNLYNAMVAPIIPYAVKGILWYQGESNGDNLPDAVAYKDLFPQLINDWRANWRQGNIPFIFVQLTNFRAPAKTPSEGNWPWVREAQLKTLSLPKTGMIVITDIGEAENIHPLNKEDAGLRLALVARRLVYGENVVAYGPGYRSMKIEGNKVRLTFSDIGNGLIIDSVRHPGSNTLLGFGIAGDDQVFVWAKAVMEGNTVVVSSDQVPHPTAVRYNWADNPPGNLYNKDGLPASPFRTDNWPPPIVLQKTSLF